MMVMGCDRLENNKHIHRTVVWETSRKPHWWLRRCSSWPSCWPLVCCLLVLLVLLVAFYIT